jgi:tetratricopeptide (TPR) repeat protein
LYQIKTNNKREFDDLKKNIIHILTNLSVVEIQQQNYEEAIRLCTLILKENIYDHFNSSCIRKNILIRRCDLFFKLKKYKFAVNDVNLVLEMDKYHKQAFDLLFNIRKTLYKKSNHWVLDNSDEPDDLLIIKMIKEAKEQKFYMEEVDDINYDNNYLISEKLKSKDYYGISYILKIKIKNINPDYNKIVRIPGDIKFNFLKKDDSICNLFEFCINSNGYYYKRFLNKKTVIFF